MASQNNDFDQLSVEIAVPGYGGSYLDSAGNLRAWVTDVSRAASVRQALGALGPHRMPLFHDHGAERAVLVERGEFAFSDLVQ